MSKNVEHFFCKLETIENCHKMLKLIFWKLKIWKQVGSLGGVGGGWMPVMCRTLFDVLIQSFSMYVHIL
jgi:hypothetical protein